MFGLDSVFETMSQGGAGGLFGGGSEPQTSSAASGVSSLGFNTGGLTVNKSDTTTIMIIASIAVAALLILGKKK